MSGSRSQDEIKTLLVDDEPIAIHRLRKALDSYPRIRVVGEVTEGRAAIAFINSQRPDLVFLDIRMPGLSGIELLGQLEYMPMIVFVTAYEEYAIKAFEKNALDYLLKPVEEERLGLTIDRVLQNKAGEAALLGKIKKLVSEGRPEELISTIPVKTGNKIQLVPIADVYFFEAKDKYVLLHTKDEERLIEYPLTYLQDRLPAEFVRVHRGYIVNKGKIAEIQKYFKGTFVLLMSDAKGSKIKTAYSYYDTIKVKLLLP